MRILGVQLYKYNIKGFLHWGLNFYNSQLSKYPINPYTHTSSSGIFSSGDGYILYPARDGVHGSIRGELMKEAIDDMRICQLLEKKIGREKVVEMIDKAGVKERLCSVLNVELQTSFDARDIVYEVSSDVGGTAPDDLDSFDM